MALSELGQAALDYAVQRGWFVFPIMPNQKAPAMMKDYYNASSREPAQITAWWESVPEANIGLDCGKSGLTAVDVDSDAHGAEHTGMGAHLAGLKLLSGGKRAWDTLLSATPSGGQHYIFLAAPDTEGFVKTDSKNFGIGGIDVRARGGYIVLPPSRTAAGAYAFSDERDILPFPRKLLSPPGGYRDELGRTEIEAKLQDGERILRGGRDNYLISFGGKLRHMGLNYDEIRAAVKASYLSRCDTQTDPFKESDFDRIATSAMKWKDDLHIPEKIQAAIAKDPEGIYNGTDETVAIPASNFLVNYILPTNWIVDGIFQGSSCNMFMGPPKAGKSTLLRHLALCVAYGQPFLGRWETKKVPVLYYTLQENKPHLRKWLQLALWGAGITELGEIPTNIPIDFVFRLQHRGAKAIAGMAERVKATRYGLVIVDMLGRFAGIQKYEDYAENEAMTDAINTVAQETGTCIVWSHHETKANQGFAGAIGSQSIRGAVYTTLRNYKDQGRYYVSTEQREGDDIPPTAITLEPQTQSMRAVGSHLSMAMADATARERNIRTLLAGNPNANTQEVADRVGGRLRETGKLIDRIREELHKEGGANVS